MNPFFKICTTIFLIFGLLGCSRNGISTSDGDGNAGESLLVFSAASLVDVMESIGQDFERETGIPVVFNFAGSGTLAKQIQAGAKADVFVSANEDWMDVLESNQEIRSDSRFSWLTNQLVVVAHKESVFDLKGVENLLDEDIEFIAVGDPGYVPAGKYAKMWLDQHHVDGSETVWDSLVNQHRCTFASDVRSAAKQAMSSRSGVGIVYKTDFLAFENQLKLLYEVPKESGCIAKYSAAVTMECSVPEVGAQFLKFLLSRKSVETLTDAGFSVGASGLSTDAFDADKGHLR